ncbi:M42 family peptidase [Exiguobacterium sp. SL-10]|uniref:M42 family metallopeptidase n=1 Tax=unclassified Exiguobacterium TaxID=2644629 RepID=UPI00103C55E8|nr:MULTISPECIES: M42 family metallopeptidase [unclassified Exiguobacterium]TCI22069.1 M42 family peptidase [Exiguobacterium sp. SL-9]TCI29546.1 M42 family peptidase [Exiguobacterium sp. SL-10]
MIKTLQQLVEIPSPSGMTDEAIGFVKQELTNLGVATKRLNKGALLATFDGKSDQARLLTAHVDTLGAMVKEILPSGRLRLTQVGGYAWTAIEGENCLVHAEAVEPIEGTILIHQSSVHVYKDTNSAERTASNIEVRLDADVHSAEEVRALGIEVGDFVSFDPRFRQTDTGYIKSRHLDDKASVAILLDLAKDLVEAELPHPVHFLISNYEEVGFGGNAGIPEAVIEYIAVDMGALGDGQHSDEYTVSICAKDSSGPYDLGLRRQFITLCREHEIAYKVDIYPYYGSDASAAISAGFDVRHALVGPGIESSHSYERTHIKSLEATRELLYRYVLTTMEDGR